MSQKIHIIGIGGTGMNGVAQLAAHAGYSVSGSDRATGLEIFKTLEKLGIKIVPQDGSGITSDTATVVYSTAIESDNPDIQKTKSLNIPLLHRADMLEKLCAGKEVIAVAGTAGKSTVTGMLGWIFQCLGKDPTVYCGASMNNVGASVRYGSGPWIIEADESDRSFLKFHPQHAVITNIAEDHFSLAELHQLFAQFESQVSGVVIKPDPPRPAATPPRRGSEKDILPPLESPPLEGWPQAGVGCTLLGKHNAENIHNALRLCQTLGLDIDKCKAAIGSFKGIERRLERVGPTVIDDFAHSPVKIAAALEAVSGEFPTFSAYWRPHGYTPLFQLADGLIEVFSTHSKNRPSDRLFILPVYFAGGTVNIKVTSEQFVERLNAAGVPAEFALDYDTLAKRLLEEALPVLGMGARDPELPLFARRLAANLK